MADTIGTYYFQLAPSTEGISQSISEAMGDAGTTSSKSFGNSFAKALGTGGAIVGGIATAIGGLSTAFVSGLTEVSSYGDEIDKMSQKLGISAEAYQEWDAVMQHSGASIDGLKMGIKRINEDLSTAPSKIEDYYEELYSLKDAFDTGSISQEEYSNSSSKLSDSLYDSLGGIGELAKTAGLSIDTIEQMAQNSDFALETVISTLQGMPEGAQRAALATDVLGRSAMELGALFNTSAADTQAMRDRVHELGGVLSDDAVKAAAGFQDQLQDMQTASQGLLRSMMSEFLPGITTVMSGLTDIFSGDTAKGAEEITKGIQDTVSNITDNLSNFLDVGSTIILALTNSIISNLPSVIKTGMVVLEKLLLGVASMLPDVVKMASSVIIEIANGLSEAAPVLIPTLTEAVVSAVSSLIDNLPLILSAILNLVSVLADSILNDGLPILLSALPDIISGVIGFIVSSAGQLISAVALIIQSLATALPTLINTLIPMIPDLVLSIIDALIACGPQLGIAFVELLSVLVTILPQVIGMIWKEIPKVGMAIIDVFKSKIPELIQTGQKGALEFLGGFSSSKVFSRIGEVFKSIWEGFKANFEVMKENTVNWGKNIIQGLIDGIASMASAVANTVTNIAGNIADAFTGFFDINSPSGLFEDYGNYIDEGLAGGITKNKGTVTDAMGDLNSAVMGAVGTNYSSRQIGTQSDNGIYGLLSEYLPYLAQGSNVNVALEGNTDGLFNLIRKANSEFRKQTGASAFA